MFENHENNIIISISSSPQSTSCFAAGLSFPLWFEGPVNSSFGTDKVVALVGLFVFRCAGNTDSGPKGFLSHQGDVPNLFLLLR